MSTPRKSKRTLYLLLLLALVILLVLAYYRSQSREKGEEVETQQVSHRTIKELVSASGKIFPEKEVIISSDVSGAIVLLPVKEGDSIRVGDLLARIDPEAYESAVERGNASVNNAKSQLAIARANLENARAQLAQIEVQYRNILRLHERNDNLFIDGVISAVDFEASRTEVERLQANMEAATASIRSSEDNIKANEFGIKSAEASLKELQTSLKRTNIYAPADGVISKLSVEEGERVVGTIQMTGTEMMRLANLAEMEVRVDVSENDILKVSLGDTAEIEVDAYLDRKFKGVVTQIANSASGTSAASSLTSDQVTNFVVRIKILPDSYSELVSATRPFPFRPGMSANVNINTRTEENVLTVPILSVTVRDLRSAEQKRLEPAKEDLKEVVFVCQADTVQAVAVKTGIQDDSYIQILSGLSVDQEVVSGPYSVVARCLNDGPRFRKKNEDSGKKKKS